VLEGLLLALASSAVLVGITLAAAGPVAWALLALAGVPFAAAWRWRYGASPTLLLLRRPGFLPAIASLAALAAAVLSAQYLFAFLAQRTLRLSPVEAGAALLLLPMATGIFSVCAGALSGRFRGEFVAAFGFLLLGAGTLSGMVVGSLPGLIGAALVIGAAQGLSNAPTTHLAMSFGHPQDSGSAGAAISFFRNIGFTAGPATVSAIWALGGYSGAAMRWSFAAAAAFALGGSWAVLRAGARHGASRRPPSS
jgi:hypothetical protein